MYCFCVPCWSENGNHNFGSYEQEKLAWEQERQKFKLRISELEGELEVARSFSSASASVWFFFNFSPEQLYWCAITYAASNLILEHCQQDIPSSQVTDPPCGSILTKYLKQFGLLGYGSAELQEDEDTERGVDDAKLLSPIPGSTQTHSPNDAHLMLCSFYCPNKQNDTKWCGLLRMSW